MICDAPIEPCHVQECDGLDEVLALLPPGQLWQLDRGGVYAGYIRALGHIKTEWSKRICQEWGEANPCTATRLLDYWADFYGFPECRRLDRDALCQWVGLVTNPLCPPGTVGFLQAAIDFVLPDAGVTVEVNLPDIFGNCACPDSPCADENALVVTGPPEVFAFENEEKEGVFEAQDGLNVCRNYYIPEIDCLRKCVIPLGLSVGYKTDPIGPNGQDIFGVPDTAEAIRDYPFLRCEGICNG